ncbi:MAG: SDR family oxidoreductase [Acidobacteriota bacterium]
MTDSTPTRHPARPAALDDGSWRSRYGPWAVVTGASDGIGRECARDLAARGLDLVLVARRRERLEALASELADEHGVGARVVVADLADTAGIERVVEETAALDVGLLVASAGFGTSGPLVDGDLGSELAMVDVNCRAVVALCHAFGRRFVERGRGGLVLLSSIVAFQGVPRAANYAATKSYIQTLAEGLRVEMAPHGVAVVASAPGPTRSGFADRADMRMSRTVDAATVARQTLDALGRRTTVRPGWLSKLLGYALATLPRWGRVRVMTAVMGDMTSHQASSTSAATEHPSN